MFASNSTNYNVVFFFISDLKIAYFNKYLSLKTMSWTRKENSFHYYLFLDKIIQNCLKINATY